MQAKEIQIIKLEPEELSHIWYYTKLYFPRERVDNYDSQWNPKGSGVNPNFTGIVGEWGFYKRHGGLRLDQFLKQRGRYHADRGDGFVNDDEVVDIKTQTTKANPKSFAYDNFTVGMEAKHLEKKFIDWFIFTAFNRKEKLLGILGYMDRNEIKDCCRYIPAGTVGDYFTYKRDWIEIDSNQLHPINLITTTGIHL